VNNKLLDDTGWQILKALQENGRLSFVALGRQVGLSPPAAAERVRRLEEAGVISGYRAEVDAGQVGLSVMAFIRLQTARAAYSQLLAAVGKLPAVVECHHLAGPDAFILKVVAATVADLDTVIDQLGEYGETHTSIVLSSPIAGRPLDGNFKVGEKQ